MIRQSGSGLLQMASDGALDVWNTRRSFYTFANCCSIAAAMSWAVMRTKIFACLFSFYDPAHAFGIQAAPLSDSA